MEWTSQLLHIFLTFRIFREKQYTERRLKDFEDALNREAVSWKHYFTYFNLLELGVINVIFNNYSPKARWLSGNIRRDEVEVNIPR
jgi:hypothetical protein